VTGYVEVREDLLRGLLRNYLKRRHIHEKTETAPPKPRPLPRPLNGYAEDYLDELEDMLDSTVNTGESMVRAGMGYAANPEASVELASSAERRALQAFLVVAPIITSAYINGRQAALNIVGEVEYSRPVENAAISFIRQYNFDLISGLNSDVREAIRGALWRGVASGASHDEVAASLGRIPVDPLPVFNRSTGELMRILPPEERANMIARTELMRAYNQGMVTTFQQYGVQLFNVVTAGDPCEVCADLPEGNPYPLENLPPIPIHPYCRCTFEPAGEPGEFRDVDEFYDMVSGEFYPVEPYGGV